MSVATRSLLGAVPLGKGRTRLRVWAPEAERVAVRGQALERGEDGVWEAELELAPGADYLVELDGREWPDPCSRCQPEGIRGPSRVVDTGAFRWSDEGWQGVSLDKLVVYELHVGTFSDEGTLDGAIPYLEGLRELGVTASLSSDGRRGH